MKFRELKKLDFVIYSNLEETYFVNNKGTLKEYIQWEYDNGLYVQSGIDKTKGKYKTLRRLIKNTNESKYSYLLAWINKGKCHRCGCKLTEENFKFDVSSIDCPFERDYFYCNSCKDEQVRFFEQCCLEFEESEASDE